MHVILKRRSPGELDLGVVYGIIAVLVLATARLLPVERMLPACIFRRITGLPCLTCGGTRAIVHLSQGNLLVSLALNPLISMILLGAIVLLIAGVAALLLDLPRPILILSRREGTMLRVIIAAMIAIHWTYLIVLL